MIADCAVDPEVFATWRHFQSLQDDFGVGRGRLISKFSKKWVRIVAERSRELVGEVNTELQAARIEERLRSDRFKRKLKSSGGREYNPELSWLANALAAEPTFDLVITSGSGTAGIKVGADDLLKDEPPFFRKSQDQVPRKRDALVGVAKCLLEHSHEVVIVDPNFRADEARFYHTLELLFERLTAGNKVPKRIEVHTNRVRRAGDSFIRGPQESQWRAHVIPRLPKGANLCVCYWDRLPSGAKPHARFLLTEMGGVCYDHGLDEGDGETLVTLLTDDVWEPLFKTFHSENLPADFDPERFRLNFFR